MGLWRQSYREEDLLVYQEKVFAYRHSEQQTTANHFQKKKKEKTRFHRDLQKITDAYSALG